MSASISGLPLKQRRLDSQVSPGPRQHCSAPTPAELYSRQRGSPLVYASFVMTATRRRSAARKGRRISATSCCWPRDQGWLPQPGQALKRVIEVCTPSFRASTASCSNSNHEGLDVTEGASAPRFRKLFSNGAENGGNQRAALHMSASKVQRHG
jgi:hypothetical protein